MIPQTEFHKALKAASLFAGKDKPGLHVVHFNFYNSDNLELAACDGIRIVLINIQTPHPIPACRFSVPLAQVDKLLQMFPEEPDLEITVGIWDGCLLITNGKEAHVVTTGPDPGDYPDYNTLVAGWAEIPGRMYLDPTLLLKILKDCGPLMPRKKMASPISEWPAVRLGIADARGPLGLNFAIHPDLTTLNKMAVYLMGFDPDKASGSC